VMQVVTISGQFSQFEGLVFCMESGSNSSTPVNDDCSVPTLVSYNRVEISINIASGYYCMFAAIRKDTTVFGRSLSLCGIRGATSTILSIGPTQGMANEATTITIRGQSFFPAMSYECLIGRQILSPAVFLNSQQLECVVPAAKPGIVQISVTFCSGMVNFAMMNNNVSKSSSTILPTSASCSKSDIGSDILCEWSQHVTGNLVAARHGHQSCAIVSAANNSGIVSCSSSSAEEVELEF